MKKGETRTLKATLGNIKAELELELREIAPTGGSHVDCNWKATLNVSRTYYIPNENRLTISHPFVQGISGVRYWLSRFNEQWFMTAFLLTDRQNTSEVELPFTRLMLDLCDQLRANKHELEPYR